MIVTTTSEIAGKEFKILGPVWGSSIRTRNFVMTALQSLKFIFGGELKILLKAQDDAQKQAQQRMVDKAERMQADAIVGVRCATSDYAVIFVYGTAVKFF